MSRVSSAQRLTYQELGTVHIPGQVAAPAIAELTDILDEVIETLRRGNLGPRVEPHPLFHDTEMEDHDGYVRLVNAMARVPTIREWVLRSDLAEVVADLIDVDSLRLGLDGTFSKVGVAAETATPWHNDECTSSLLGEHMPTVWIALTDVDENNSPLITLAGSHRDQHRYYSPFSPEHVEPPPNYLPWSELLARAQAPDADIRVWPVKAGDILVNHPKTIHASQPRRSDNGARRLAFTVRWLGSDVVWDPNPLTMLSPFDTNPLMERGKPPPEELFPVVWRR